ncbi:hypothetical protein HMPREF3034_01938 [Prevotella sp. DNF00663]|nr:hypothetical protein HMPREF3034_01938 [Prevotella sp. DNF00663]
MFSFVFDFLYRVFSVIYFQNETFCENKFIVKSLQVTQNGKLSAILFEKMFSVLENLGVLIMKLIYRKEEIK